MKLKRLPIILLGIILIIIQIISLIGMSKVYVGLYPDNDDLLYSTYSRKSDLTFKKALFAVEAGFDRFQSSFDDLTGNDKYRFLSSTQMTSAMVRESLGCSDGGSLGLKIYDTILTVSYLFTGLLGVGLLVASRAIKESE